MSLYQFWTTIRAAWLKIALMTLIAGTISFVVVSDEPKLYTAKARVMLNLDNTDATQYSAVRSDMAAGYISTEMRLIVDDAITRDVAKKLGWPDNPQVIAAWEAATGGAGDVTAWAAHQIAQNIHPQQLEDSAIIEIFYTSSSVDAAKQIVALVRTSYIEQSQRLRAEAARRASAWNRTQAARALTIVRQAEATRDAFVQANQIAVDTPVGGLDYGEQLATMNMVTRLTGRSTAAHLVNPTADELGRKLNSLDAEIAVHRLNGERDPMTVALETNRATTAQQLAREKVVIEAGPGATDLQIGLVRAQRDADYLKARLNLIDRAPLYDRLATLDRDVILKTGRFNAAAARVADFEMAAAAPSGQRVIGDVIASDTSSYPNVPLVVATGAGTCFALGVALALVGELQGQQVRSVEDLVASTHTPVLATIAAGPRPGLGRRLLIRLLRPRARQWPKVVYDEFDPLLRRL